MQSAGILRSKPGSSVVYLSSSVCVCEYVCGRKWVGLFFTDVPSWYDFVAQIGGRVSFQR